MHQQKILAALRENYRSCTSYEDAGIVQVSMIFDASTETINCDFSTIFIRPNLLKFDINVNEQHTVLQADGQSIREIHYGTDTHDSVGVFPNLSNALDTMQGVSFGVLSAIFGLLQEEATSYSYFHRLTDLKRLPDESIEGGDCYRISGKLSDRWYTIWALKENNTLRRIEEEFASAEMIHKLNAVEQLFAESEEREPDAIPMFTSRSTIDFKQVTFNNSITIDAIG